MLSSVSITNYALIDRLELEFDRGFNIITGETGAGKSVLLGALGLVLGQRADSDALFDKSRKCIVEARFSLSSGSPVMLFLKENDFETDDHVLIRRELSPEGRSRSFINDTPASLQQLKEVGAMLVDIHSQHETLLLNKSDFQLSVLDALAGTSPLLEDYKREYRQWQGLQSRITELEEQERKSSAEQDYLRFQLEELSEAALKAGEQSPLESELQALSNSGAIREKLETVITSLEGDQDNLIQRLSQLTVAIQVISKYSPSISALHDRLRSVMIELKDILDDASGLTDSFMPDASRVAEIEARLDVLYRLEKKHRVNNVDELIGLAHDLEKRFGAIGSISESLNSIRKESDALRNKLLKSAKQLSASRSKVVPKLEKTIRSMMTEVSLPNATFSIELVTVDSENPGPSGSDKARFLFSANKGVLPAEIGKSASGGELSRLMLCIKSAVAESMELPVMIFDEIDTGISGETALKMGGVLKRLSGHHQLLAITHLPQIAGKGDVHFFVKKKTESKRTVTDVVRLDDNARLREVARMLSGENPSAAAIANAKELLEL